VNRSWASSSTATADTAAKISAPLPRAPPFTPPRPLPSISISASASASAVVAVMDDAAPTPLLSPPRGLEDCIFLSSTAVWVNLF
jgi:hypothetical protein